jgi:hypothetical protein
MRLRNGGGSTLLAPLVQYLSVNLCVFAARLCVATRPHPYPPLSPRPARNPPQSHGEASV